jgi:hypothetical protein
VELATDRYGKYFISCSPIIQEQVRVRNLGVYGGAAVDALLKIKYLESFFPARV